MKKYISQWLVAALVLATASLASARTLEGVDKRIDGILRGDEPIPAAALATNSVTSQKITDGTILRADLNSTNAGIVTAKTTSRGLQVELGSCTGTAIKAFSSAFGAAPAVVITLESLPGTNLVAVTSLSASGFTASGFSSIVTGSWIAVGIAP